MRTTLDIAEDVLFTARALARRHGQTLGESVSALARRAIADMAAPAAADGHVVDDAALAALGVVPLPRRGGVVTDELVEHLREQEGI